MQLKGKKEENVRDDGVWLLSQTQRSRGEEGIMSGKGIKNSVSFATSDG